jgi:hypothetical protein
MTQARGRYLCFIDKLQLTNKSKVDRNRTEFVKQLLNSPQRLKLSQNRQLAQ